MDYKIKWIGSDNDYTQLRKDSAGRIYKPEIHVLHIMQGSLSGTDSHFNNTVVDASTHFGIGKNGEIHQYVSEEHGAWGNGLLTNPDWEWAKAFPGVNPNLYSLSYELEGMSGDSPTAEQWDALLYLLRLKSAEYGIPAERRRFAGHFMIDPVNRGGCPGTGFPWDKLYKEFGIAGEAVKSTFPVVAFGAEGETVRYLQSQLNARGFNCGETDGKFGKKTLEALKSFQKAEGIAVDGIAGPVTWACLT